MELSGILSPEWAFFLGFLYGVGQLLASGFLKKPALFDLLKVRPWTRVTRRRIYKTLKNFDRCSTINEWTIKTYELWNCCSEICLFSTRSETRCVSGLCCCCPTMFQKMLPSLPKGLAWRDRPSRIISKFSKKPDY